MRLSASFVVAAVAFMLAGFSPSALAPPMAAIPSAPVIKAKLGFTYLTKAQEQDLWRRADQYAMAEAFLKQCATVSNIEPRRVKIAGARSLSWVTRSQPQGAGALPRPLTRSAP